MDQCVYIRLLPREDEQEVGQVEVTIVRGGQLTWT